MPRPDCFAVVPLLPPILAGSLPSTSSPPAPSQACALVEMPRLLPAVVTSEDGTVRSISWDDHAAQLNALRLAPPSGVDDAAEFEAWLAAISSPARVPWSRPEWRETFGVDWWQVDQAVSYGEPPHTITLLRGRFDAAEPRAAWNAQGYRLVDLGNGVKAYAVRDDYETELTAASLSSFNVLALLPDGVITAAPARTLMRRVIATFKGALPSVADRADIGPLARSAPPDLATAFIWPGLERDFSAYGCDDRVGLIAARLYGITAGGPLESWEATGNATPIPTPPGTPEARVYLALTVPDPVAAAPIIAQRLATERIAGDARSRFAGMAYAELFPVRMVRATPGESVVEMLLERAAGTPRRSVFDLVFSLQLSFDCQPVGATVDSAH